LKEQKWAWASRLNSAGKPLALILLTLALVSRNPARVLHPVLFAEDGRVWFEDAYRFGFASVFFDHGGYLCVFVRLIAWLGLWIPIRDLPHFFVIAGIAAQMAPVALMLWRGASIMPSGWARGALMCFYVGMPDSEELFISLTNSQWHLALVSFLLVVLDRPKTNGGRIAQGVALAIFGLTGPFSLLLAPIAVWHAWGVDAKSRSFALIQAAVVIGDAAIQFGFIHWGTLAPRLPVVLGAGAMPLLRILVDRIFLGGIFGYAFVHDWQISWLWKSNFIPVMVAASGLILGGWAFWHGWEVFRKLTVFGALILASGLISPLSGSVAQPAWQMMDQLGNGSRYDYMLILAWFSAVVMVAARRGKRRFAAWAVLPWFLLGIAGDWKYDWPNNEIAKQYHKTAKLFAVAPVGAVISFPEHPANWVMTLTKK